MSNENSRRRKATAPPPEPETASGLSDTFAYTLLLPVVITALVFRIHELVQVPPGIWPDEAANAIDGLHTLRTGGFKAFYPANSGREGLFVWLQAASIAVWGNTLVAMRMPSVIIGTLTVFLSFFTTRRLLQFLIRSADHATALDPNAVALLTALFLGVSHWHLNFSRTSFRGILDPLFGLAAVYTLLLLLEKNTYRYAIVAGLTTGIGLYGYSSYRIMVIPLLFLVAFNAWRQYRFPAAVPRLLSDTRLWTFVLAVAITAAPLVMEIVKKPDEFFQRSRTVSVFAMDDPASEFRDSALKSIGQFHIEGDGNWRHNLSQEPALPILLGICFGLALLAGPALILGRIPSIRQSAATKIVREYTALALWLFLSLWLVLGLLPAALTAEGRPHFLRSISSIPPTYILTALGCFSTLQLLGRVLPRRVATTAVLLLALLLPAYAIGTTWNSYFHEWATHPSTALYFMTDLSRVGHRAARLPNGARKFVVVGGHSGSDKSQAWSVQPFVFLTNTETAEARAARNFTYISPDMLEQLPVSDEVCYFILVEVRKEDYERVEAAVAKIASRAIVIR